jgi:eukaryotic-like serine/threonine-protein kinase
MPLEELQNGRYRLLRLIGKGAMGEVYLAQDKRIDRQVAIKVILTGMLPYPGDEAAQDAVRLFHREAQTIARLNHPHILPLFDFDEASQDGSTPTYMVMPYCPEGSFDGWLQQRRERGLLAPRDVVQLVNQAADALQYAHDYGIVHRDVKPANFLIHSNRATPDCPDLLLADFGVAKLSAVATRTGPSIRGTPIYMAPEQWNGVPVPATDQYALAVMTYDLLTGRTPFQGSGTEVMYQHLMTQPSPPGTFNPHLPPAVDAVVMRALAKDPSQRFPSISDFARALQQALLPGFSQPSYGAYTPPPASSQPAGTSYTTVRSPDTLQPPRLPLTMGAVPPGTSYTTQHAPDTQLAPMPVSLPGVHQDEAKHAGFFTGRNVLLIGLVLLVILAGVGVSLRVLHQNSTSNIPTNHPNNGTATASPTQASTNPYYPKQNILALNDPLRDNSKDYMWDMTNMQGEGSCGFANNAYHAVQDIIIGGGITGCNPEAFPPLQDFTFQVQLTIVRGDAGGITFRVATSNFYLFAITPDGSYHFDVVNGNGLSLPNVIKQGASSAIQKGLGRPNLLAVVALGNKFDLYVNNQRIDTVTDGALSSGQIGLAAEEVSNPTDVMFNNAMVWKA